MGRSHGTSRTFGRGILRTIRGSLKRFVALAVICALGTAMLVGLTVACKDLRISADEFYDGQELFDVRVISTLGLDDDDIEALSEIEGVEVVEGGYTETAYTTVGSASEKVDVKALSETGLNDPYLVDGRLPETTDEIAVTEGFLEESGLEIGDTVTFHSSADEAEDGETGNDEDDADGSEDADDALSVTDDDDSIVFTRRDYTIVGSVLDPMNINAAENTMSFRSSGGSDFSFFLLPECVDEDVAGTYTVVYLRVEGAAGLLCYSDEYEDAVQEVVDRIDAISEDREQARTDAIKGDATEEIDDAEAEAEQELADAQTEIDDAQAELDDAQAELDDAQAELDEGADEIADGWEELETSRTEAEQELADAQEEIDAGYAELDGAQEELNEQLVQVEDGITQIDEGIEELDAADETLAASRAELESAGAALVEAGLVDADLWSQLVATEDATTAQELADTINATLEVYAEAGADMTEALQVAPAMAEVISGEAESASTRAELEAQRAELEAALAQIEEAQAEIDAGYEELDAAQVVLDEESASAYAQLDEAEATLSESEEELAEGQEEIDEGQEEIDEGQEELDEAQAELDEEGGDALAEIADARTEVDDIEDAVWYVQDRSSLASFSSVDSDASSIESIGNVIPVVFFVVGVLISLTTMTRMVDEERTLIGLYKALGYSTGRILSKYALYALASVVVGVGAGYLLGFVGMPLFLFYIFEDMYTLPSYSLHFSWFYAVVSFVMFAVCIVGATLLACWNSLREDAASLMRPKTPAAGSRVLLERVGPLWRHLSFLNKVTARNLFRYKRRFLMTVVGIAGTTALLVCGFGIRDTVISLSERQYGDGDVEEYVNEYDLMVVTASDDLDGVVSDLEADSEVEGLVRIYTDSVTLKYGGDSVTAQLVVVPEGVSLEGYINLWNEDGDAVELPESGALVTVNARQVLGFSTGDTVTAQDSTLSEGALAVEDIALSYLGNYVFMSETAYEEAFGTDLEANGALVTLTGSASEQTAFAEELSGDSRILSSVSTQTLIDDFSGSVALINTVVYLIIAFAAALSFTVVFTLCNTNISERERELATLKVLGFRRREVHTYVNKETIVLTLIGILVGLPLGFGLTNCLRWVLKMPSLYFDVVIEPLTYPIAAAFAIVFTLIVDQMTNRTLDRIDMVEALKSAE